MALALVWGLGCEDETQLRLDEDEVCFDYPDGRKVCIDSFEVSRSDATPEAPGRSNEDPRSLKGRHPWNQITWQAARDACASKGERLCEADEWIDACDGTAGEGGLLFPYGDERDESNAVCNVDSLEVAPSGGHPGCVSGFGVYDMAGNLWEWTGNRLEDARALGGGYRSTQAHRCRSGTDLNRFSANEANVEVGFRCCRDG